MLKYIDTLVGFSEIPDEITLCINVSNCPNHCEGCHSPWLSKDEGTPLTYVELKSLINKNKGITCVCFMGGDREPWEIQRLAKLVQEDFNIKVGWYSGCPPFHTGIKIENFNYIKVGSYIKELGPLTSKETNQKMYQVVKVQTYDATTNIMQDVYRLLDITYKFHKQHEDKSKRID